MDFKLHLMQFDSVQAVWSYAQREPQLPANRERHSDIKNSRSGRGVSWFGVNTAQEVFETKENGWSAGAKRVQSFADQIKADIPVPHSIRRKIKWSDQGDSLDIHRVWSGRISQAWESHPRQRSITGQQTVTIFSQIFQTRATHSDYGFYRGAAVLALADLLIEAGYNVEIVAGMIAQGSIIRGDSRRDAYAFMVNVKSAIAQLDISSLAATLALAGFFRVGMFMAHCVYADDNNGEVDLKHGLLVYNDREYYAAIQNRIREQTGQSWDFDATECGDERTAIAWVKASIAKLQQED